MRVFQMLFPMLVSALYLTRRSVAHRAFVDWLCVGVLLKGTYNLFFVALFAQGHWYYGASVFVANLVLSLALDYALISTPGLTGFSWRRKYVAVLGEILLVLFSMNAFVNDKLNQEPGLQMQVVFERRAVLTQMVRAAGGNGFLEFDDGILGFATGIKSISGFGLVGDTEARLARKHGRFLDLAMARGDALVMARGGYANQLEAFSKAAVSDPHQQLYGIRAAEFRKYALQPVATDGATDVRLYRLIRRP